MASPILPKSCPLYKNTVHEDTGNIDIPVNNMCADNLPWSYFILLIGWNWLTGGIKPDDLNYLFHGAGGVWLRGK